MKIVLYTAGTEVGKFTVRPTATVGKFKADLASQRGEDVQNLKLLHKHAFLEDTSRWIDTLVIDEDALTLVLTKAPLQDKIIGNAVEYYCRGGEAKDDVVRRYGHIEQWDTST